MRRSFELITGAIIWYTMLVSQRLPERILNMHASVKWALRLRETYVLCYPIQYRKFSLDIAIYSHFLLNLTHLNVSVVAPSSEEAQKLSWLPTDSEPATSHSGFLHKIHKEVLKWAKKIKS